MNQCEPLLKYMYLLNVFVCNFHLGVTSLIAASTKGKSETVQLLLDKGADVNAKNDKGNIFSDICLF